MRKSHIALAALAIPALASAQSAIDAQQLSQPDFKGTARFMSMGGAFTALGGDLSTLTQNPAGIGVYRRSEIGATLDLDFQNSETPYGGNPSFGNKMSQTKAYCNNVGYIGSTNLDGAMRTFNWGVSYNRAVSFDRVYTGYVPQTSTSLSNYVASFSNGINAGDMDFTTNYNPYLDSDIDWLSILSYSSYLISPDGYTQGGNTYSGLFKPGTAGDALCDVREQGYMDEYDISFGGNVEDIVYWGVTFGINDINYTRWAVYSESMGNAGPNIPSPIYNADGKIESVSLYPNGSAYFNLDNYKNVYGSGWNIKAGLIIKPVNEFRIGLAVHTPTWYKLTHTYNAILDYTFTPTDANGKAIDETLEGSEYTEDAYFNWRFSAPWKLMIGAAAVIGQKAILSLDYELDAYNSMRISTPTYDNYGYVVNFVSNNYINNQIDNYFRNASNIRAGLEYRVTPQFSVRAGYNLQTSNVHNDAYEGAVEVITSGTDPSYSFDKKIQHFSLGLGYKYQAWYIDAAYVYRNRESTYHAYTNWPGGTAPALKLTDHNSQIVLSTGFKF